MPKNIVIIVGTAIAVAIGGAIIFFDEPKGPDSGEEIEVSDEPNSPDSGEEVDVNDEPNSPDSGEEVDVNDEPNSPDSGEEVDVNDEPNSPDSGEEISLSEFLKNKARYSCNFIAEGSTCIDYIGSFWSLDNARMNCSGNFAKTKCPRPYLGGCRIGADTSNEIVTWHYGYGGDPYTEALPYAKLACTALPGGQWVE